MIKKYILTDLNAFTLEMPGEIIYLSKLITANGHTYKYCCSAYSFATYTYRPVKQNNDLNAPGLWVGKKKRKKNIPIYTLP